MNQKEIFEHLFRIGKESNDKQGIVAACLVRGGKILADGVSTNDGIHAEYALLQELNRQNIAVTKSDIVYTTIEPCGKRTQGGLGEEMGDCTTNLINAGIKHVVYGGDDNVTCEATRHKFGDAEVALEQITDGELIQKATELFSATRQDSQQIDV